MREDPLPDFLVQGPLSTHCLLLEFAREGSARWLDIIGGGEFSMLQQ